ncbi:MAG: hypothetical protein WC548_04065 [Candidatus Pacearchaeota archaeon]
MQKLENLSGHKVAWTESTTGKTGRERQKIAARNLEKKGYGFLSYNSEKRIPIGDIRVVLPDGRIYEREELFKLETNESLIENAKRYVLICYP